MPRPSKKPYLGGYCGRGFHLFPFRTEKLSPPAPMVLQCNAGRVGGRPFFFRVESLTSVVMSGTFFCLVPTEDEINETYGTNRIYGMDGNDK